MNSDCATHPSFIGLYRYIPGDIYANFPVTYGIARGTDRFSGPKIKAYKSELGFHLFFFFFCKHELQGILSTEAMTARIGLFPHKGHQWCEWVGGERGKREEV